jgi:hypothetical protein
MIEVRVANLGGQITSPVLSCLSRARPAIRMIDGNGARRAWIFDLLGQFGAHVVEAFNDAGDGSKIAVLAHHFQVGVFYLSTSVSIYLLPVVSEETDQRPRVVYEAVNLQRLGEIFICVLVFINENDRVTLGKHPPKFRLLHELYRQRQDIVMMKQNAVVLNLWMAKVVFNGARADTICF